MQLTALLVVKEGLPHLVIYLIDSLIKIRFFLQKTFVRYIKIWKENAKLIYELQCPKAMAISVMVII